MGGGGAPPQPGVEIPNGAFIAKITNDAREEEMEENMEQVGKNRSLVLLNVPKGTFIVQLNLLQIIFRIVSGVNVFSNCKQ